MAVVMLETERLLLRPFNMGDVGDMYHLAGDKAVAEANAEMPYPLAYGETVDWVEYMIHEHEVGNQIVFVIADKASKKMLGSIELILENNKTEAELGYWLGVPYWGHGFCTEASVELVKYGFETYDLNRVFSICFEWNGGSRRVAQKLGMRLEKSYPIFIEKWDRFEIVEQYGITAQEYKTKEL